MIYYIHDTETDLIKIGFTFNFPDRLFDHRYKLGDKYRLIGFHEGNCHFEHQLHQEYADLRVRGEWFRPGPDLMHRVGMARRQLELVGIFLGAPAPSHQHPNVVEAKKRSWEKRKAKTTG